MMAGSWQPLTTRRGPRGVRDLAGAAPVLAEKITGRVRAGFS